MLTVLWEDQRSWKLLSLKMENLFLLSIHSIYSSMI